MQTTFKRSILSCLMLLASAASVSASQMNFEPRNPIFQPGNQLNASAFQAIAEATKKKEDSAAGLGANRSLADVVQSSVLANVASQINNKIFCTTAPCTNSGSFDLGNGSTITYLRDTGAGTVTINIGGTTIVLPI